MTTDNRTNEPNKYSGFLARQNHQRDPWRGIGAKCLCGKVFDLDVDHALHQVEEILCAALVAAQGAAPQAEQATYLNVAHSSVLAGSINARRPAREVSAMQLIDAIYDPDGDDANDSVRYGYVLEQFERLRIIYADLDDPDAGLAPVLPSSGVDEDAREFRFTDAQWREYQSIPMQGYSHRDHLEHVFNEWLMEQGGEGRGE